ncbi:hypothetical protein LTR08_003308 [Meristemomyces frigidus]|nr:hypothetical protein LTR08_003308 [Meristemomyces frigidus]
MDSHHRGRSPSAGQANYLRHSNSASPHPPFDPSFTAADNAFTPYHINGFNAQTQSGSFVDPSFTQDFSQQAKWSLDPTYPGYPQQEQSQQHPVLALHNPDVPTHTFLQSADLPLDDYSSSSNHVSPHALSQNTSPSNTESSVFPSFDFTQTNFNENGSLDPSLLDSFDSTSLDLLAQQQVIEAANQTLDPMATLQQSHSPTAPHLLPSMARRHSASPSPHASPNFQQAVFHVNRPRNTSESLDPASAMYPQGQGNEWTAMGAYRGHRRTPSDNLSEISSHSNQNSPYMGKLDGFDPNGHSSPLLHPSQDPTFNGDLGLQGFSLSEIPPQHQYISPGQSPHHSPLLVPQQALPQFTSENNYGLSAGMNGHFVQQNGGLEMFPGVGQEPFPSLNHTSPGDFGAADQMSPPEINIDYAPPTKTPVEVTRSINADDTLSPPLRSESPCDQSNGHSANMSPPAQSRGNRTRAKSDSYASSRSSTPSIPRRGRSPSLQPQQSIDSDTLAPFDNRPPPSRSPSPARGRNGSVGTRVRSSSGASDHRDYLLDLADPERAPSNGADSRRAQKHPATFQCGLCPKRFTRAYNLRSHLRTHTDERPFVCTVCGKAFARQHDRKRHEGLHSGEKKFVCKGTLQCTQQWGCGRRFARADALGRHFRSEAGRVCIKPLLDEEAAERQKAWMEEQQQAQVAAGFVAPQPMLAQPQMDMMNNFLPAALLQQYPALAGIDWNTIPQGPPPEEEVYSGRSSYDASSGGEYYDDMSESELGTYPHDPTMAGMNDMNAMNGDIGMGQAQQHMNLGQQVQPGAQGLGVYGHQTGDYLSEFEGR